MRCALRAWLTAALVCGASSAGAEAPRARTAAPGEAFGGKSMRVLAPPSEGWIVRETPNEIWFGHRGASKRETYVAMVMFFELPALATPEAFTEFIRTRAEADFPPERFSERSSSVAYTDERSYPCVRYSARSIDQKAPGGPLPQVVYGLCCRYPQREGLGFAILYSQRAKQIDADLEAQAQRFFAGVEVPAK